MKILIAGCGKLGMLIAERLIEEKHDVTIIDRDEAVLDKCVEQLDALTVKGSGVSITTLQEADVMHADIVIASTMSDETNMLCSLTAKKLGAKYTVARIRDPEYLKSLPFLTKELSINYVMNPERATAREISRILRLPFAVSIETFARGLVELVEIKIRGTEPFANIPLKDLYRRNPSVPRVLFCIVERDMHPIIPKGDFVIHQGDRVFVAADTATITAFFKSIGMDTRGVKDAIIVGGSRIAYYLAQSLCASGVDTKIIERKLDKARFLSEELEEATIIHGDGTDYELLMSEGLDTTDAFISLTDRDEENLLTGLYAHQNTNAKVVVKNTRLEYPDLLRSMGLESIINPRQIACNIILRTVRARMNTAGTQVERMYKLSGGKVEALEFVVKPKAPYIGIPLRNLNITDQSLVAVIVRNGQARVPFGDDIMQADDHVVIITKETGITDLEKVFG